MSTPSDTIKSHLKAAAQAFQRGDVNAGRAGLHELVAAYADHKPAILRAADLLRRVGLHTESLSLLEDALPRFAGSVGIIQRILNEAVAIAGVDGAGAVMAPAQTRAVPDDWKSWFVAGECFDEQKLTKDAVTAFRRAMTLRPDTPVPLLQMVAFFRRVDQTQDAIAALEQILALDPTQDEALHMHASLTGSTASAAPATYIEKLFDHAASAFEHELVDRLKYRTPWDVLALLKSARPDPRAFGAFLDLGCGTGLVAGALRSHYHLHHSTGIDLSQKMLDVAAGKGLYDELLRGDAVSMTAGLPEAFDLITAIDVPVYIGDLWGLIQAVADHLNPGGLFVYSLETMTSGTFKLLPTMRFAHTVRYVEGVGAPFGLKVLTGEACVIRLERGMPVEGYVGILIRA